MSFARLFVPRRKENVLNLLILLAFCAGIVFYYRLDADHWSTGRGRRRPTKWSWERKPVDPSAPGENGQPVILQGEDKIQGELDMKKWFMNVRARFVVLSLILIGCRSRSSSEELQGEARLSISAFSRRTSVAQLAVISV